MKRLLSIALLSAAVLSASGELSNRRAPGFSLPDIKLKQHDVQDYRGRIVIIDIMKTDCPHCQTLSKALERVKAKYGERVAILSVVNPPDNQTSVGQFIRENNITSPILFDCGQVSASYLKVTPQNPAVEVPHLFLLDANGIIRNDWTASPLTRAIFEGDGLFAEVDKLLKEAPAAKH